MSPRDYAEMVCNDIREVFEDGSVTLDQVLDYLDALLQSKPYSDDTDARVLQLDQQIAHLKAENARLLQVVKNNSKTNELKKQYRNASLKLGKQNKQLKALNARIQIMNLDTVRAAKLIAGLKATDPMHCGYAAELFEQFCGLKVGYQGRFEQPVLEWPGLACTKAPAGWFCTRDAGHEGPCAAKEFKGSIGPLEDE